ncbi:hypothetical protein, partial [Photobacterium chitinilyticum]
VAVLGESDKLSWACNVLAASAVVRSRKIELNGLGRSNRKTKGACSANLTRKSSGQKTLGISGAK